MRRKCCREITRRYSVFVVVAVDCDVFLVVVIIQKQLVFYDMSVFYKVDRLFSSLMYLACMDSVLIGGSCCEL